MSDGYAGEVRNGVVVFDEGTSPLPEGTKVRVEPEASDVRPLSSTPLLELIDQLDHMPGDPDWPTDAAARHDSYLYGPGKRP